MVMGLPFLQENVYVGEYNNGKGMALILNGKMEIGLWLF